MAPEGRRFDSQLRTHRSVDHCSLATWLALVLPDPLGQLEWSRQGHDNEVGADFIASWPYLFRSQVEGVEGPLHEPRHGVITAGVEAIDPSVNDSLAIGNVPFADIAPADRVYNPNRRLSLHYYAIVKALAAVEPGAAVVVITSPYTLDAVNPGKPVGDRPLWPLRRRHRTMQASR
jgi:hypothetical protein